MRNDIYFRILKKQPYMLIQFNGISIIDINQALHTLGYRTAEIWIYRELPVFTNTDKYETFFKSKVQHNVRKRISSSRVRSATDCITIGENNPLIDLNLDEIIDEKVNIANNTKFFAFTHDFDWEAYIYINEMELFAKFMAYFTGKAVKLIYSNNDSDYE